MDNNGIAGYLTLLSKLTDIHGENSFKAKTYSAAAFAIEKLSFQLSEMPLEKISGIKGIGASTAQKVIELLQTGKITALEEKIFSTPPGVMEMLKIKGIGPKKIHNIWKEMGVESIGELLYACKENRLKNYKGFGEKTQQNVIDFIEFYLKNKDSHLYATVEPLIEPLQNFLLKIFPANKLLLTGKFKRQLPVIDEIEFVIDAPIATIEQSLAPNEKFNLLNIGDGFLLYNTAAGVNLKIYTAETGTLMDTYLKTSSSEAFYNTIKGKTTEAGTEEKIFEHTGLPFVPSFLRENPGILTEKGIDITQIIQPGDIKGIIHCHSNWSDGSHTIEQMAIAARDLGLEYLVISDHSKSAFYAQGLFEEKVFEQHKYVEELNGQLKPFKIFKSIESDILNNGNLDYDEKVLASFDLVIASIHSNLKMPEEKAMMRLLKAIKNPFTTILGHLTGRLLLSREGYPVNHSAIIDACVENNVAIELNANPYRLDIDWQKIEEALKKGAIISINPDSHETGTLTDTKYGVLVAQKAGLTRTKNLSSFSLLEFEAYIQNRKKQKAI